MNSWALLGAVGGGAVGAILWATIGVATGLEIGYVAWAVGALVGVGCYALGGRGQAAGTVAAVVALVSIFAGKALIVRHLLGSNAVEQVYNLLLPKAEAFAAVRSEEEYPAYMVAHEFTEAKRAEDVKPEEVALFKAFTAPVLEDLGKNRPTVDEWRERPVVKAGFDQLSSNSTVFAIVLSCLTPIDLIFLFLGVGTAYRICRQEEAKPKPTAA